ncbi:MULTISPECIES: N-acetylmuramoyl-L-alanine amidase family protein [Flavobacterium]|uniref:N-acetylmuramoyl-L-alanine amidase n=1 Tax=Flavobacterium commune TaxID=1306519 RepID=A0A1D9PDH1_9FLAO|nr:MULTISPECIES: N-acetylmuramoyl-L-alanine amidase [Flavobacterium]APA00640.1 N-acetylmuramoyl-L-alanine amidase [Flavobacterium commune]
MKKYKKTDVLLAVLMMMVSSLVFSQSDQVFKVTLDAGHGGHDFGAAYNGHVEKNIALAVVLKVGKILESHPKVSVIYTRKTDVFIDLIERANIANRANANIFVSIHCNANRNTAADGTETYVMGMTKIASNLEASKKENAVVTLEKDYQTKYEGFDPNSPETMIGFTLMQEEYLDNSISLASKIQNGFAALGKKIRGGGVKQAPFMVLHKAYMPRVLIEMGFISNYVEGNILASEEGQDDIARAIADAIISYKSEYFGGEESEVVKPSQRMIENSEDTTASTKSVEEPKKSNPDIVFKVQLAVSRRKLELAPKNFKGLKDISMISSGKNYKYFYGQTSDYELSKNLLTEAKAKGFDSAYLVAFKNGNEIDIQEAIK